LRDHKTLRRPSGIYQSLQQNKDKKRTKIKIEHGKLIFGPQHKQQQNITSYPSLLLLQTRPNTKEMEIQHTHKQKHKLTACTEE
jgi:hypothetical protein